jgi:hypothetical protein
MKSDALGLQELSKFFDYARHAGVVSPNAVHNWSGAVGAIAHCLGDEEATVEFIRSQPEVIRNRLTNGNRRINRQTIEAYLQRASSAIDHFLLWKRSPEEWQREMSNRPRRRRNRKNRPAAESAQPQAPRASGTAPLSAPALTDGASAHRNIVQIPTEGGSHIKMDFPDAFRMSDVLRAVWALSVHASDFDPEQVLKCVGKPASRDDLTPKTLLSISAS